MDDGEHFVGAFMVVKGASPPRIPEFRSQVPNGFRDSPSEYRFLKFSIQLLFAFGVGEVPPFAALEEAGADVTAGVGRKLVKVGVALESEFLEETGPALPGPVVLVVCPCCFGVVDSCFSVTVEKIQEEISLGRGTMRKFDGTWCARVDEMKDVRSGGGKSNLRERMSATELWSPWMCWGKTIHSWSISMFASLRAAESWASSLCSSKLLR